MIIDYDVLEANTLTDMRELVLKAIKEGWQPQGAASIVVYHGVPPGVYQTVVKIKNIESV